MPALHQYRLFISHAWRYSGGYDVLVKYLAAAPNFNHANYSVPESKAFEGLSNAQLKEQLKAQIRSTQVCLIIAGMYVNHSDWIQLEIEFAQSLNKPIIGLNPWASQRTPAAVQNAAREMVNWNTSSIVAAIRRAVP